jgi:hypothetical protein
VVQPERIADGDHPLAHTQAVRVAQRSRSEASRVRDAQKREVEIPIDPDHLRVEVVPI